MTLFRKINTAAKLFTSGDYHHLRRHPDGDVRVAHDDNLFHAAAAADWLLRANEVCEGRGFSQVYTATEGWRGPYVETTGYIIPSLYAFTDVSEHRREEILRAVASSLEFLMEVQSPEGAFGNSTSADSRNYATDRPQVFDTGQVMFGLLEGYRRTNDARLLASSRRAGDWLLSVQETDGRLAKFTYSERARTYYSRVAHALAELFVQTGEKKYRDAADRKLRWVVAQQAVSGAYNNCSFTDDSMTVLHVIAYTIDGLWKAGSILGNEEYKASARKAAVALAGVQKKSGVLAGHYDLEWRASHPARCLTGLAQMAEVWLMIYRAENRIECMEAADTALTFLKKVQLMDPTRKNLYGGLIGSHPWDGPYYPYAIPNWAQKFYIDALLQKAAASTETGK